MLSFSLLGTHLLGHPLVDVNYLSRALRGGWQHDKKGAFALPELPSEWEFVQKYHERRSIPLITPQKWVFFEAMNQFRLSAIVHGVYARGLQGVAASGNARNSEMRDMYSMTVGKSIKRLANNNSSL
jgi:aminoglycoside phosphotransferase (APT) family kinase protein